jgi:allantoinase
VHAEDPATVAAAPAPVGTAYRDFLASRPPESEERAIDHLIEAVRRTGGRAHVLHLSDAGALPRLAAARAEGLPLTVETCPHYLTLSAEQVPDGATPFKCCPPIRDERNREALWQGLADGLVDIVVSDHSPSEPALKHLHTGNFGVAWGGISSLQVSVPAVWTAARSRGLGLPDLVRWMGSGPADLVGLPGRGRLAEGQDADLVVLAPDETWTVDPARLHHRHPISPYAGATLSGVVRSTWLRGRQVGAEPHGRLLRRGQP